MNILIIPGLCYLILSMSGCIQYNGPVFKLATARADGSSGSYIGRRSPHSHNNLKRLKGFNVALTQKQRTN